MKGDDDSHDCRLTKAGKIFGRRETADFVRPWLFLTVFRRFGKHFERCFTIANTGECLRVIRLFRFLSGASEWLVR